jgi:hypothetical protein
MNELYDLDASHNSEIRSSWYQLCINAGELSSEGRGARLADVR